MHTTEEKEVREGIVGEALALLRCQAEHCYPRLSWEGDLQKFVVAVDTANSFCPLGAVIKGVHYFAVGARSGVPGTGFGKIPRVKALVTLSDLFGRELSGFKQLLVADVAANGQVCCYQGC